jgi:hypothetical protein
MYLMADVRFPKEILEFFRETGARGGQARAERHTKKELKEWGKLGGRPKGSGKKQKKGGS